MSSFSKVKKAQGIIWALVILVGIIVLSALDKNGYIAHQYVTIATNILAVCLGLQISIFIQGHDESN